MKKVNSIKKAEATTKNRNDKNVAICSFFYRLNLVVDITTSNLKFLVHFT